MYTSGTTGRPKGAIRSHGGSALISLITALDMGFTQHDTALLVMPMCHANSLYFSFTFTYLGATSVIDDRKSFDPEDLLRTLAEQRITFTSLVPTHYIMMLALPGADAAAVRRSRSVRKLMISSAPARRETKLAIMQRFPNAQPVRAVRLDRGRLGDDPAPGRAAHEARLGRTRVDGIGRRSSCSTRTARRSRTARSASCSRCTPYTFDGYWKDPEKTAEAFRGAWCSVGDMARRDEDGYYHLVDRKSNMIISGGENVYPSEVEAVLAAHPAVQDVAVIGVPDEKWGEAVHAVVVPKPGSTATEAEIIAWCRDRIAGYKRPRSVSFIADAEMPRTATGKIQHRLLRDRHDGLS